MTKGKWKATITDLFVPDEGKTRKIYVISGDNGARWIQAGYIDSEEDESNAHAMAAVPLLIEALQNISINLNEGSKAIAYFGLDAVIEDSIKRAKDALAEVGVKP